MRSFQVEVWWDGQPVVGVSSVSPVRTTTDVITFRDQSGAVYKVPGHTDTGTVTLQRGVSEDLAFDLWATGPQLKKDVELRLTDGSDGLAVSYWLFGCWVSEYAVLPDLGSGSVLELLTLSVNRWRRVTPSLPALADELAQSRSSQVRHVRLSEVMSDRLEETEQRLETLLEEAQRDDAVLLLDEGDALFARRTDVQDAHDRYQRTQLDTVLDRLAAYQGQVLVVPPDPTPPT